VKENDAALESFSVAHDREFRIPFIKKAIAAAGGSLTLFASPWSPPAWMKDTKTCCRGKAASRLLSKLGRLFCEVHQGL